MQAATVLALSGAALAQAPPERELPLAIAGEDFEFDAVLQADLDALLANPVELVPGASLDRLAVLPWIDAAALATLAAALPVQELSALERVPGWDAQRVRRLAPFVRPALPARTAPHQGRWFVTNNVRPAQWDGWLDHTGLSATLRRDLRDGRMSAAAGWQGVNGGVALGGIRATQGLGLVFGPQAWGTAAGAGLLPVPSPAQLSLARQPWLRGVALHARRNACGVYAGRSPAGALRAGFAAWERARFELRGLAVRAGSQWRAGAFAQVRGADGGAALEAACGPEGTAFAIAAQDRAPGVEWSARFDARPADWGMGRAAGPSAQASAVQARVRWRHARGAVAARAAHGWEVRPDGERRRKTLQAVDASLPARRWMIDAVWSRRQSGSEDVEIIDLAAQARDSQTWALRATHTTASSVVAELRAWRDTGRDHAWRVQWAAGPAARRLHFGLTGYSMSRARSVPLPLAGTAADSRVRGTGLRFVAAFHAVARGVEWRVLGAALAAAPSGWDFQAHGALGWRWSLRRTPAVPPTPKLL